MRRQPGPVRDLQEKELKFVESRKIAISKDSKHQGSKVLKVCEDCQVVISIQYGFKSKVKADEMGIKLVTDEGPIGEVLKRYIDHYNFMKK